MIPQTLPDPLPDDPYLPGPAADRLFLATAGAAVVLLGAVVLGGAFGFGGYAGRQFFFSYLFGYTLALDVSLGALFWVLIHHVADAGWSVGLRRVFENVTRAIPVLAVLFVPIAFFGLDDLYGWTPVNGKHLAGHERELWEHKRAYLNPTFFLARMAGYFAVWIGYSVALRWWSIAQDATGDYTLTRKMWAYSPFGLVLLGLTSTFAAFDLLMSLQWTWFSTIYGVYFWAGGFRGSLAFAVLLVLALRAMGYLRNTITVEHLHNCGQLLFGLTVFWAYIAFAQYFLIWYGNMPEETQFYLLRRNGAWAFVSYVLLPVGYFVVPFFLLLPRANKRNPAVLGFAAAWVLAFHAVDLYWQVLPNLHGETVEFSWMDLFAAAGMLAAVAASAAWGCRQYALIPIRDVRLNETIGFVNETP